MTDRDRLIEEAQHEFEALANMSYTGWRPDITGDGMRRIRELLRDLVRALQDCEEDLRVEREEDKAIIGRLRKKIKDCERSEKVALRHSDELDKLLQDCEQRLRVAYENLYSLTGRAEAAEQRVKELEYECAGRAEQMSLQDDEERYLKGFMDECMKRVKELEGVLATIADADYEGQQLWEHRLAVKTLHSSPNRLSAFPPPEEPRG